MLLSVKRKSGKNRIEVGLNERIVLKVVKIRFNSKE